MRLWHWPSAAAAVGGGRRGTFCGWWRRAMTFCAAVWLASIFPRRVPRFCTRGLHAMGCGRVPAGARRPLPSADPCAAAGAAYVPPPPAPPPDVRNAVPLGGGVAPTRRCRRGDRAPAGGGAAPPRGAAAAWGLAPSGSPPRILL